MRPNPYAGSQPSILNGFGVPTKRGVRLRNDPMRGTDLSNCSTSSATCSTCPTDTTFTDRDSTLTEGSSRHSSSARSSTQSDITVVGQPLLPPPAQPLSSFGYTKSQKAPTSQPAYAKNFSRPVRPAPQVPTRMPQSMVPPSRSLVDLVSPHSQQPPQRRNSTGKPIVLVTSM